MLDDLERSKVKNLNHFLTLKWFILGTKFVLVTDRKLYVAFQMAVSPLMFDDLKSYIVCGGSCGRAFGRTVK